MPPPAELVDGVESHGQAALGREPIRDLLPGQPLTPELPNPFLVWFQNAVVRASTARAFLRFSHGDHNASASAKAVRK